MRACRDEILQVPISLLAVDEGGEICNHRYDQTPKSNTTHQIPKSLIDLYIKHLNQ
jgi:hypothetical protein